MFSLRTTVIALAASLAAAQSQYNIDPESVDITLREHWCDNELSTCPLICNQLEGQSVDTNICDPESLSYECVCGNGQSPNITEYTLTLPYFICQEWGNQCVANCADDACSSSCREDNPCGARDPSRPNATTTSGTSEPTESSTEDDGTTIFTDTPGSANRDSNNNEPESAATIAMGRTYGLAVVLGSLFVGFAML